MPIRVDDKGGPVPPLDPQGGPLEDAGSPAGGPQADEYVPNGNALPKTGDPQASLVSDGQKLLFGKRPDFDKLVSIKRQNNALVRGYTKRFKDLAGQLLGVWDLLLAKVSNPSYKSAVQYLKGAKKFAFSFEVDQADMVTAKNVRRSDDGTVEVTLAMSRGRAENIIRNLSHGMLAFFIVAAASREEGEISLSHDYVTYPELYTKRGSGLLYALMTEAEKLVSEKNDGLSRLRASLRKGKLPKEVKTALRKMYMNEEDATRIFAEMADQRLYFDLIENDRLGKNEILIRDIESHPVMGGVVVWVEFDVHPKTLRSLTMNELCLLLARGYILNRFYANEALERRVISRHELSTPMVMYARSYYDHEGERTKEVVAQRFANDWIKGVSQMFETLYGAAKFTLSVNSDFAMRGRSKADRATVGEARQAASNSGITAGSDLEKMLQLISRTSIAQRLGLFSGVDGFIVRAENTLQELSARARIISDGDRPIIEIIVPLVGHEALSRFDVLKAIGEIEPGRYGSRQSNRPEDPLPTKRSTLPEFLAFFRLWLGYSGRAARLTDASRLDLDGSAGKEVLSAAAQSLSRIFASSKKEYFSAEGAAVQAWLKGQKVIHIEHVKPIELEDMAQWERNMQGTGGLSEAWVVPAEHGVMIMINGRAPTPAQWDHLFVAAYLGKGRAFSIRFDDKGGVGNISGSGDMLLHVKDYMERLAGRKASTTMGAESNEAWVSCTDAELKAKYVEALRWMQMNRGKIPDYLQPKPTDDTETLKGKYRTFSKLYHPDYAKTPAETELYKDGVPYWDTLKSLAKVGDKRGDADGEVVIGGAAETRAAITVDATGENGQGRARRAKPEQMIARMMERDGPLSEEDIIKLARGLGSDAERLRVQMNERGGDLWDYLRLYVKEDARDRLADRFKAPREGRRDAAKKPRDIFRK